MKIATWNVNSVKARKDRLLRWLGAHEPDVLCLQELKLTDDKFPLREVREAGYHALTHGQKTYNGVAILTREPVGDAVRGMDDGVQDPQARLMGTRVGEIRILSAYIPNGSVPGSDKFAYKLQWLQRLLDHLDRHYSPEEPLALCGDLNIAPDARDVARPEQWDDSVLCVPQVRDAFKRLLDWGLVDTFRKHQQDAGHYSWWDYRMLGFPKNNGLRIDHILATAPLAARCSAVSIDRPERKGKLPSDHAPVIAIFD